MDKTVDELNAEIARLRVQLAGCAVVSAIQDQSGQGRRRL